MFLKLHKLIAYVNTARNYIRIRITNEARKLKNILTTKLKSNDTPKGSELSFVPFYITPLINR